MAKQITSICSWFLGNAHIEILTSPEGYCDHMLSPVSHSLMNAHNFRNSWISSHDCMQNTPKKIWVSCGNFLAFVVVCNLSRRRPPPDLPTCLDLVTKGLAAWAKVPTTTFPRNWSRIHLKARPHIRWIKNSDHYPQLILSIEFINSTSIIKEFGTYWSIHGCFKILNASKNYCHLRYFPFIFSQRFLAI